MSGTFGPRETPTMVYRTQQPDVLSTSTDITAYPRQRSKTISNTFMEPYPMVGRSSYLTFHHEYYAIFGTSGS